MEKRIKILAYTSVVTFLLILILRMVLKHKSFDFYNLDMRKVYVVLTYFIFLPLVAISELSATIVLIHFIRLRFKRPLFYLFLIIPSLIYLGFIAQTLMS